MHDSLCAPWPGISIPEPQDERASPAFEIHSMYPLSSRSICCCRLSFKKARRFSTRSLSLANSLKKHRRVRSGCFRNFRESVCVYVWGFRIPGGQCISTRGIRSSDRRSEYYRSGYFCQLPTFPNNCTQLEKKQNKTINHAMPTTAGCIPHSHSLYSWLKNSFIPLLNYVNDT